MDRFIALEKIKELWDSKDVSLGEKITDISTAFYAAGLDVASTAAYIKATPAEFDSILALSALDEEIIELISDVEPPKTTWMILSNANEEEIIQALNALKKDKSLATEQRNHSACSEFIYQKMMEVSGPTVEQLVGGLPGDDLKYILKKGMDFGALTDWQTKFLKSVSTQKKRGKVLSDKQIVQLIKILNTLIDKGAIVRDSIDGDQEICDRILDALGK